MLDSHVQAVPSSAGQVLSKVRKHARALRNGKTTRAYVAKRFRNLRQVVENVVGRKMVLWQRRGYWVPRALQSVRQANKSARRDYVVKPYGGPVTHFTTKLSSGRSSYDERWQTFATGVTEFHEVGGTHESMVFEPHSRGLAAALARCLDRAWNGVAQPVTQPAGTASGDDRAA
jgi:hypothetical protein